MSEQRADHRWGWLAAGAAAGAAASLLAQNLTTSEKKIAREITTGYGVDDPQFRRVMSSLLGPPFIAGNTVDVLQNGDEIFPAMLAAIRGARSSVCFETYIYWSGEIARELSGALAERARAGVSVHVVMDGVGAGKLDAELVDDLLDAGVQLERYHPLGLRTVSHINNRTHRKLLIVDGRVGFTGGVGIADQWAGRAQDSDHWRDMHFRVAGPVVAQMQAAFADNWLKTRAEALHDERYFPEIQSAGPVVAQLFKSSPDEGSESVRLMYLLSIAAARRTIRIANAYFVPDDLARQTLISAVQRGVRLQIIVPGREIDTPLTRQASRSRWEPLLEAGAEIHEFQPTMFHCKAMVIDDLWCSVGSTNFDSRSFRLNDEANLNIYDAAVAAALTRSFDADLARSRRVTLEAWRQRPLGERIVEQAAALVRSQV
ncbi:MAG: cardiolipin synthase B [Planctomycetes bacterium]|nr:cardiolipin synthase B [Planctomycetota bacterium]